MTKTNKRGNFGFLADINDDKLNTKLFSALENKEQKLFVVAASGKVNDTKVLQDMYATREMVEENKRLNDMVDIHENYFDDFDGINYTASLTFIKKTSNK